MIRDDAFEVKKEISASISGYSTHTNSQSFSDSCHGRRKARATQIAENPVRSVGRVCRPLVRWHRLRLGPAQRAANLLVLPHALESLCKLRDQRSFAGLETALFHNAPEKIASRPLVRIVDGQQIFGGATRHKDDDVGF